MVHDKIINSINIMISDAILKLYYYGEFCQFINFKESIILDTCGVNVDLNGMNFFFNNDFINELDQEEVNFVVLHEIFHLLWDHQSRTRRGGYDKKISNIVQDMIINQVIKNDIIDKMLFFNKIENRKIIFAKIPKGDNNETWVLLKPIEYKGELIFEELYEWLIEQKNKYDNWVNNNDRLKCPVSDYLKNIFENLDDKKYFLDIHIFDDIPEEYRKSIIDSIKMDLKNRGILTNDVKGILDKLTKSKKDYIKNIKVGINELFGDFKNKSITKKNRRNINGLKGKRKNSYALNVLMDVSGSMDGYLEKSISYIFQNDIKINFIQCDTEVKSHTLIKNKRDFKKIEIKGYGGTILQSGIDYISNNKKTKDLNTLILTDGYTDILNTTNLKRCMIISNNKKCNIVGKAKQILIK